MGLEARHAYRVGYLQSEHWQNLRIRKLAEQDAHCFFCGLRDASNDVHHVHYPVDLLHTKTNHLRVLCREHHTRVHSLMEEIGATIPEGQHKEGRDFMIFRKVSGIIENEMRRLKIKRFSVKGKAIRTAGFKEVKPVKWVTDKCPYSIQDRRRKRQRAIFKAFRKAVFVMDLIQEDPEYFDALPDGIKADYHKCRDAWIILLTKINDAEIRDIAVSP